MSKVVFNTSGSGLWSSEVRAVRVVDMQIGYIEDEFDDGGCPDFGELRVYFDTKTWDTYDDGLIYTDDGFLHDLSKFLVSHGLPGEDVSYSEQGMQGGDYVSLVVSGKFLDAWGKKFGLNWTEVIEDPRGVRIAASGG